MSFLLSLLAVIGSYQVVWQQTEVDVKLYDSIYEYVEIPTASLYIDGELIDTEVTYRYNGVNKTFISTVITSYVKSYAIDYEVYFIDYDIKETMTIHFNVIDDIAPVFEYIPTYQNDVGTSLPDFYLNLIYNDNYDLEENLDFFVDAGFVDVDHIGSYPIYYYLTDQSLNQTIEIRYIEIIDRIKPVILLKKDLIMSYGITNIETAYYFQITDNYDVQPIIEIDDHLVNYNQLGTYDFDLKVCDQSGQMVQNTYQLTIIDDEPPELILKLNKNIAVYDIDILDHLDNYILSLTDNYDAFEQITLSITNDIDIDTVGSYSIYFLAIDQSSNQIEKMVSVKVVDEKSPTVTLLEPLKFDVYEKEPFLIEYFLISDNYDQYENLDIDLDTDLKMDQVNQYQLILTVTDQSKNKTYYYDYIIVVDEVAPIIIQVNDILITQFEAIDYDSYFGFTDNYDAQENISFSFDDTQIIYEKIGQYELLVYATDLSTNIKTYSADVFVVDVVAPSIVIKTYQVTKAINESPLNLLDYVISVSDNYDDLEISEILIFEQINDNQIGAYEVIFQIYDTSLNYDEEILIIIIDDLDRPYVEMSDLIVMQYQNIDYLSGIQIKDESDVEIYYDSSYIDTSKIGTQYLTYIIQDE
ncbi:MAG: hypothetical protein WCR19_04855, partial [Acholeplasmataceae bacterium]